MGRAMYIVKFFLKSLRKHCGASSLSDLKTIVSDSLLMCCAKVFQPSFSMSVLLGVLKSLLKVTLVETSWHALKSQWLLKPWYTQS